MHWKQRQRRIRRKQINERKETETVLAVGCADTVSFGVENILRRGYDKKAKLGFPKEGSTAGTGKLKGTEKLKEQRN